MYTLWYLCAKPEGSSVARAWQAVETLFSCELWDDFTSGFESKSAVLAALRTKAVSVRDNIRNQDMGWGAPDGDGDVDRETGDEPSASGTVPT